MKKRLEHVLDDILVIQARSGDLAAAERLVERHQASLRYFLIRMLGPRDAVDDLAQEVWLAVFRQLRGLKSAEAFSTWMYRIARNRVYDLLRKARAFEELPDDIPAAGEAEDEFTPEDAAKVNRCLGLLNPAHREVLLLRFLENMSYEQIAEVVGLALGTVKSRIHHAKLLLRQKMEHEYAEQ
jgi:RNA polymerase sigma-70 factor (ECF subfamily)